MLKWKVFVLSLARVRERRLAAISQMCESALPFEIVDAIDAKQLRPEQLVCSEDSWEMSNAEIAVYNSHMGLMDRVVDYNLDYGVILEDDFVFGNSKDLDLYNIWEKLPRDADHVQLHDLKAHFYKDYQAETEGEFFNKLARTNVSCFGYVVSRGLAKYINSNYRLPRMPFDHLLIEVSSQKLFSFYDVNARIIDCNWKLDSTIER